MRIAIVNDLRLACEALRRAVTSSGQHEVAWTALDGAAALEMTRRDRPDLILMDMIMPGLDGVGATRKIMKEVPCPILVVTSTVSGNISKVFEALGHGALDVVQTPTFGAQGELTGAKPLLEKIARIEHLGDRRAPGCTPTLPQPAPEGGADRPRLVLIGSSTGGPKVLADILAALPRDLPAAVVIAQHVDSDYAAGLASWLAESSRLPVSLAQSGQDVRPAHVYVAPSSQHLTFSPDRRLALSDEADALWYRPSIDVLFNAAAQHWRVPGVAVLLTGMGRDGASGLATLRKLGWTTIAQDQASSVVWGMPKAAIELNAAAHVLPASAIAATIIAAVKRAPSPVTRPTP
jgi:chemotaxis response regulator CheB